MGRVFAYEDHNGWKDSMFITDHELSDIERFCPRCELWSEPICEVHSKEQLIQILADHGIVEDDEVLADTYRGLMSDYEKYSAEDYKAPIIPKKKLPVGIFFFVDDNFTFSECSLSAAKSCGDYLIFPKSHRTVWESYEYLGYINNDEKVDYDHYPRGRVVYRKTDDLFIIYYDKCIEDKLDRITRLYAGYNLTIEQDPKYHCYKCNELYTKRLNNESNR